MLNQAFPDGSVIQLPAPSAVTKGMPVLVGQMPAVAVDDYNANTGRCTFLFDGIFYLTVVAASTQSPVSGIAIKPGDELFATGSLDATTNITYGLTINATRGNIPFGNYLGSATLTAGTTNTLQLVRINQQVTRD